MKALILVGGLGVRLRPLTIEVPKPMLPIDGRPLLEHHVLLLKRHGFDEVVFGCGYLAEVIKEHFGDGSAFGIRISYSIEEKALGTAGAIKLAERFLDETFVMFYGDVVIDMDFGKMVEFHKAKGAIVTQFLHKSDHPYDSDIVEVDDNSRVTRILGKPKPGQQFRNLTNAGVYVMEPSVLDRIERGKKQALDSEVLPGMIGEGLPVYGYISDEHVKDMGTPERYEAAQKHKIYKPG